MFPIKYIDNNLVWNKDNEVFAYYELIPYNYSFLSAEQKFIVHTIEPGTETLSLTADPREDGLVKSRTGDTTTDATYNDWYKAVYVPVAKTTQVVSGGK